MAQSEAVPRFVRRRFGDELQVVRILRRKHPPDAARPAALKSIYKRHTPCVAIPRAVSADHNHK